MQGSTRTLIRIFVTGLLAALPLVATIAIFAWAGNLLAGWLGPNSGIGRMMASIGFGITGSEFIGYLIGVSAVLGAIFGLGLLVEANLQRGVARVINSLVRRIPLVNSVYELVHRMVDLFSKRGDDGLKSMRAVWCHFGGPGGAAVLALLSNSDAVVIDGRNYLAVLVPTAPVPVGGGLLWVPQDWVTPADVGIEALTSIYVSMGVTAGQYLPRSGVRPVAGDAAPMPPGTPSAVPPPAVPRAADAPAASPSAGAAAPTTTPTAPASSNAPVV
jgi:uncharacterized membrane protein